MEIIQSVKIQTAIKRPGSMWKVYALVIFSVNLKLYENNVYIKRNRRKVRTSEQYGRNNYNLFLNFMVSPT